MGNTDDLLRGKRILIVDDEPLLAFDMARMVEQEGGEVIGPALSLPEAARLAEESELDAGLLDIDLDGAWIWPVAHGLLIAGTPFAFISAQTAQEDIPSEFANADYLPKPASERRVIGLLREIMRRAA